MSRGFADNNKMMDGNYRLDDNGKFVIRNYNQTPPFSNFLPGIAGAWGIPAWVFYVNRGQGVVSFGIKNKDHSIVEFLPANKAYWLSSCVGFRTFLKINKNTGYEPFRIVSDAKRQENMTVSSAGLEIVETSEDLGLRVSVKYYTLPNSPVGGLVRVLSIKNISALPINLEALDGLPRLTPFGAGDFFLKNMARTLEAWMHAFIYDNLAVFRLIVDPADVSETKYIQGANFHYSFYERAGEKQRPYLIVDPAVIFGYDTSYFWPVRFFAEGFSMPLAQMTCGKKPCTFSYFKWDLAPGQEQSLYNVFGAAFKLDLIQKTALSFTADFLKEKESENTKIIEDIKGDVLCLSHSRVFGEYIKSTYLDNVLRGGYPYKFDGKDIYYIFSRKHGDLERDYNRFELLPSYFSEGEANYRDINQNRRMDLFFNPVIGRKNSAYFMNFIRMDGYNPLVVKGEKLLFSKSKAQALLKAFKISDARLVKLMEEGFHLGAFFKFMEEEGLKVADRQNLARRLVEEAEREPAGSFGEGFWIDHWFYNLDHIETCLYFFPEKEKELFLTKDLVFWDDEYRLKPQGSRYEVRGGRVFQIHGVEPVDEKKTLIGRRRRPQNFLRTKNGKVYKATLAQKLLVLILNKLATLDPDGIGVEMEAGKPGWCDSLNGLPALFGSSICETIQLKRACLIFLSALGRLKKKGLATISVAREVSLFLNRLDKLLSVYFSKKTAGRDYLWWRQANIIKEEFRKEVFLRVRGEEKELKVEQLEKFLAKVIAKLDNGIKKAKDAKTGVYFTYFIYEVKKYTLRNKAVVPLRFKRKPLPLFLEGPMHALRVEGGRSGYEALKKTELFDKKLKMYRLNASLKSEPLEIGRSRVFVPGWLENESIWLHMEYKYLLEVLRAGFYEDFFRDFYNCCVCFFDPARYGRNVLENSSFIVSSVYPDKDLWGRGFVARLSGATAELLNIWILLVLGKNPFFIDKNNDLCLKFSPILKGEMFTTKKETVDFKGKDVVIDENCFAFKLFSSVLVVYHNPPRKDTFSDTCRAEKIVVHVQDKEHSFAGNTIFSPLSLAVREKKVERIDVYLE